MRHTCPRGLLEFTLLLAVLAMPVVLSGCASEHLVVPIDVGRAADIEIASPSRAQVMVTDIRRRTAVERTALGVRMGDVELNPSEKELVQTLVEAEAGKALEHSGVAKPIPTVLCGIEVFDITTPSTPLYWDVRAEIRLVLRVRGQDRRVSGQSTERTFIWPSAGIIARVTSEALRRVGTESERALAEMLTDAH